MPLFCIDRSHHLAALPRSPQRAARLASVAGAGGVLALVGVMVAGGSGADGAGKANAENPMLAVGTSPMISAATPLTPVATEAATTTTLAPLVCTNSYTVASGDYWVLIAQEASITTGDLLAANRATTDTPLYPNQVICLPDGVAVVVPTTVATTEAPAATTPATTKATTPVVTPTTVKARPAPVTTVAPVTTSHSSR